MVIDEVGGLIKKKKMNFREREGSRVGDVFFIIFNYLNYNKLKEN